MDTHVTGETDDMESCFEQDCLGTAITQLYIMRRELGLHVRYSDLSPSDKAKYNKGLIEWANLYDKKLHEYYNKLE